MIPQFEPVFDEKDADSVANAVRSGYLNESKLTREFERVFADFVGAKYAIATTSGTAAIFLALRASGIGQDDRVAMPVYGAIGTATAVRLAGAHPVLVDVANYDGNLSYKAISEFAARTDSSAIQGIVVPHMNGRSAQIAELKELASENGWPLIEDAAQCLGSRCDGKHLGTFAELGCFSLATTKIITTGQGGIVVTDNGSLYDKLRALKDQGRVRDITKKELPDWYPMEGYNFKFTEMQSALGLSQMAKLRNRIEHKRHIIGLYHDLLTDLGLKSLVDSFLDRSEDQLLWYVDVLLPRIGQSSMLQSKLREAGIDTRLFYLPLYRQEPFRNAGSSFPGADDFSGRGLWLPSSSNLLDSHVHYVCDKLRKSIVSR